MKFGHLEGGPIQPDPCLGDLQRSPWVIQPTVTVRRDDPPALRWQVGSVHVQLRAGDTWSSLSGDDMVQLEDG